jgi:dTDP-L-rhamnose 4-epimerase
MARRVLITGGAGFIGSHLADELLEAGYAVRVFDNCAPQVHGAVHGPPPYLSSDVEFVRADIQDGAALRRALRGVDSVVHLAAMVGVGQSMYEVADYTAVNDLGTAILLQALLERPVGRLVVASSMSVYGEGRYRSVEGEIVDTADRSALQLKAGRWEPMDARGTLLEPVPTPEDKRPNLSSVYALNKYAQERLCLLIGPAYDLPTIALRFFNVYGTRQALSNPYTGVLAIFASRLLNGNRPLLFEDGQQRRDFVHVRDVARACRLALEAPPSVRGVFNVGSGESRTICEVFQELAATMEASGGGVAEITGRYRVGDVRHCFADITRARSELGFEPRIAFADGIVEFVAWLAEATAIDRVEEATGELMRRGLVA